MREDVSAWCLMHAAAAETVAHLLNTLVLLQVASSCCCCLAAVDSAAVDVANAAVAGSCLRLLTEETHTAPHMLLAAALHLAAPLFDCTVRAEAAGQAMPAATLYLLRQVQAAAAAS